MDLGFTPLSPADAAPLAPVEAVRVMAALAGDPADGLAPLIDAEPPLAPASGAFSVMMAARLAEWRRE